MKYLLSLFLVLSACASHQTAPAGTASPGSLDYLDVVEKHSDKVRRYSGFYNTLDIEATALNSLMAQAQLTRQAELMQWDEKRAGEEKIKFENRLNKEAEFFLSFFTPERKNDDLFKPDSMWKIFLDVEGRRYEGKVTKIKAQLVEIQALYPYHNRFYTPYTLTFPVPMRSIENKPLKVTITGAVGSGTLEFKP